MNRCDEVKQVQKNCSDTVEAVPGSALDDGTPEESDNDGLQQEENNEKRNNEKRSNEKSGVWRGSQLENLKDVMQRRKTWRECHYDCIGLDGLNAALDPANGWLRSVFHSFSFLSFMGLFLFLTIPTIQDYLEKNVSTTTSTIAAPKMPLPIVTVCPHGSGVECQCVLWRRLQCRYKSLGIDEWRHRFDYLGCANDFDFQNRTESGFPRWVNPQCEDFENEEKLSELIANDPCGSRTFSGKDGIVHQSGITGEELFQRILMRENRTEDGPSLSTWEMMAYGASKLEDKIRFSLNSESPFEQNAIPDSYVRKGYIEWTRLQRCIQVRVPPINSTMLQTTPGAGNGVKLSMTGLSDDAFSLMDLAVSSPAIDVHIDVPIDETTSNRTFLFARSVDYEYVAAGTYTSIAYSVQKLSRYQGWGSNSSQTCYRDANVMSIRRDKCSIAYISKEAASKCGCDQDAFEKQGYYVSSAPPLDAFCSATIGSTQFLCAKDFARQGKANGTFNAILPETCPYACEDAWVRIDRLSSRPLSSLQSFFIQNFMDGSTESVSTGVSAGVSPNLTRFSADAVASMIFLEIGAKDVVYQITEESPSATLGVLMGSLGGNLGLWCGLSLTGALEIVEYMIVATLAMLKRR